VLSELFEFVTVEDLEKKLEEMGLKFERLAGGRLCILDRELNDSGICFYFDMSGNVYGVEVETGYIGDKQKFREFLRRIREKYGLSRDVDVEVKVRDFVWLEDVERKIKGEPVIEHLGEICTFDDDLNAEVCFRFERKYGRDAVTRVKIKTKFLGGKEKFRQFLDRLRRKYGLPRTMDINVITVPEEKLEETKWFYEKRG